MGPGVFYQTSSPRSLSEFLSSSMINSLTNGQIIFISHTTWRSKATKKALVHWRTRAWDSLSWCHHHSPLRSYHLNHMNQINQGPQSVRLPTIIGSKQGNRDALTGVSRSRVLISRAWRPMFLARLRGVFQKGRLLRSHHPQLAESR